MRTSLIAAFLVLLIVMQAAASAETIESAGTVSECTDQYATISGAAADASVQSERTGVDDDTSSGTDRQQIALAANPTTTIDPHSARIVDLTDKIVRALIDFERYILEYRRVASWEPKFRRIRYYGNQEAEAGLLTAVGIGEISEFGRSIYNVRPPVVKKIYETALVATVLGGAGAAFEFSSNGVTCLKNKINKHDPATARKWVIEKVHEVDALLAQRDALVNEAQGSPATALYKCEGWLFKYCRDQSVYEFADWYADAKSYQASNNTFYALNMALNALGAVAAGNAIQAITIPKAGATESVSALVADGIGIPTAPVSFVLARKLLYNHARNSFARELNEKLYNPTPQINAEAEKLDRLVKAADTSTLALAGPIQNRLDAYSLWDAKFNAYLEKRVGQLRHVHIVAQQSAYAAPLINGAGLSGDILSACAFFNYEFRPKSNFALARASGSPLTAAAGVSFLLTGYYLAHENLFERKLRKERAMPKQQIQDRLETLDKVEAILIKKAGLQ